MNDFLTALTGLADGGFDSSPELRTNVWLFILIVRVIGLVYFLFFYIKKED